MTYYEKNKEKMIEYQKDYYQKNREERIEYQKKYQKTPSNYQDNIKYLEKIGIYFN